ncbi:MAG: hypothetical protein HY070_00500 [Chloroflexi bacterium]|nr:hypothetical protein [Chloroflexota bacterium]MBI3741357.1 hypothetical protein [Chloroflexota bacterium]
MLAHKKIKIETRDFFKQPFTPDELRALLRDLNLRAHDVLAIKSRAFRAAPFQPATKSETEIIALMVREPRLIRRPLIVLDGKPVIGFDRAKLNKIK